MIDPKPTHNNRFAFQKIFTELDYLAGGILVIPAGAEKPTKPAKDNSYVSWSVPSVSVSVTDSRASRSSTASRALSRLSFIGPDLPLARK